MQKRLNIFRFLLVIFFCIKESGVIKKSRSQIVIIMIVVFVSSSFMLLGESTKVDTIAVNCKEFDIELPGINQIFSAKWSPNNDKILVSGAHWDDNTWHYGNWKFLIISMEAKNPSRIALFITKIFCPSMHHYLVSGMREVLNLSSAKLGSIGTLVDDAHWVDNNSFVFGGVGEGEVYNIYRFIFHHKRKKLVFQCNEPAILLDILNDILLISKPPEEWFHIHGSAYNHGILSLHSLNLNDSNKPKSLQSVPSSDDTTIILEEIFAAQYIEDNQVIYLENFIESPDSTIVRRLEVLNLKTKTTNQIRKFSGYSWFEHLRFAISPSNEWIIFTTKDGKLEFLLLETGNSLRIKLPNEMANKFLNGRYMERNSFEVLDWSLEGRRILFKRVMNIDEWDGYHWNSYKKDKLYIMEVPDRFK